MFQVIAVWVIILAALVYVVISVARSLHPKKGKNSCEGCSGCQLKEQAKCNGCSLPKEQ